MQHATLIRSLSVVLLYAAGISSSQADILEDFHFNDDNGTLLGEAVNAVNPGNTWIEEQDRMTNSSIQGGVFRVQKDTTLLGRNILDITNNISIGKGWIVAEIAGWSFSSIEGPNEFDPSALEQFRLTFLNNDSGLSNASSFVTAEARIQRTSAGGLELFGTAIGTGGSGISGIQPTLPLNQTEPFTFVLELDKNVNEYSIYYRSASDSNFSLFGTSTVAPDRAGNSMRLAYSGSFAGTGEFFDLDRLYVTTTNPLDVPVAPSVLTLGVQSNGVVSIFNPTNDPISFDSYRITSSTGDLDFAGWNSLSDQGVDAVNSGLNPGETWTEAGGSNDEVLAESFLLGSTTLSQNESRTLGNAFQVGGDIESLQFEYRNVTTGTIVLGNIEELVSTFGADFNGDGFVDGSDFLTWQRGFGLAGQTDNSNGDADGSGIVNGADLTVWESEFGAGGAPLVAAAQVVPEPTSFALIFGSLAIILARRSTI